MKKKLLNLLLPVTFILTLTSVASAFEILTTEDFVTKTFITTDLVKTADNAIIIFDSSKKMEAMYKDTGKTLYEVAKKTLIERNEMMPDMGHNIGLYSYSPWKEIYPLKPYDHDYFGAALNNMPEKPKGPTLLMNALNNLESLLKKTEGRTVVFLYTDGTNTDLTPGYVTPLEKAEQITEKYGVCFYLIDTSAELSKKVDLEKLSEANFCSRIIPFEAFVEHPEYNMGALFVVKANKNIISYTETRVVGIKTPNVLYGFDSSTINSEYNNKLDKLGEFLNLNKEAFAVLAGYADATGPEAYNLELSYQRADSIATYLTSNHNVNKSQLILLWLGQLNPAGDNMTKEGRRENRRVEIAIGGF